MRRGGRVPASERGFAMVAFVAALGAIALVFVVGQATITSREANSYLDRDRGQWLDRAAGDLRSRYFRNPADQVSAEDAIPEATLLARAGVSPRWGARLVVSKLLTDPTSGAQYSEAVLWLPGLHDRGVEPAFDLSTGKLSICPGGGCVDRPYRRISGLEVQRSAIDQTRRALEVLAAKADVFAKAQYLRDPEHDSSRNPFRAASCTSAAPEYGRPPCIDSYVPVTAPETGNLRDLMGFGALGLADAWGNPILVSNWQDSSAQEPPYSMAFKAVTPWGADLIVMATQPL